MAKRRQDKQDNRYPTTAPIPCGKHFNRTDLCAKLESSRGGKSVEDLADEIGVSWQHLYKMRSGKRPPNEEVLDYLKMDKVELYQERKK